MVSEILRCVWEIPVRFLHLVALLGLYPCAVLALHARCQRLAAFLLRRAARALLRICGVVVHAKFPTSAWRAGRVINMGNHDIAALDLLMTAGYIEAATVTTRRAFNALNRFFPSVEDVSKCADILSIEPHTEGQLKAFYFLRDRLKQDRQVFLSPSGTQKKRITQTIRKGLFLLAKVPGVVLRPIFIVYEPSSVVSEAAQTSWVGILYHQLLRPGRRISLIVTAGEPFSPDDFPSDEALGRHIKQLYQSKIYDAYDAAGVVTQVPAEKRS